MDLFWVVSLYLLPLLFYPDIISAACPARTQYSRSELLQLNFVRPAGVPDTTLQIPGLIRRYPNNIHRETGEKRKRKRGRRGGVRLRLRKMPPNRLPLPSMILGNVQSLRIKWMNSRGMPAFLRILKSAA